MLIKARLYLSLGKGAGWKDDVISAPASHQSCFERLIRIICVVNHSYSRFVRELVEQIGGYVIVLVVYVYRSVGEHDCQ